MCKDRLQLPILLPLQGQPKRQISSFLSRESSVAVDAPHCKVRLGVVQHVESILFQEIHIVLITGGLHFFLSALMFPGKCDQLHVFVRHEQRH